MNDFDFDLFIGALYLVAVILFVLGLKRLASPKTARSGNCIASLGMLIAVVVTLVDREIVSFELIIAGIIVGAIIGSIMARAIKMTAMPQMVAVFNGLGGAASALVAAGVFHGNISDGTDMSMDVSVTIMIGTLIGAVTFSGSLIAFGKLQEIIATRPVTFPLQKTFSLLLFVGILAMIGYLVIEPDMTVFIGLSVACLLLGILLVIPIGGADMPVVISLLNSYSGLAAASAGFVLGNVMLIIAGALVGAAGLILTQIMTKAMNRSLVNVVFGAFGAVETVSGSVDPGRETRPVREVAHEDSAVMLAYARSVIFVPGYGLAVAQAQHQLKELGALIEANGVAVKYAIHPVAGRMPGHMNVLLAEADVPYDKLYDLEQINDEFSSTDVVVVVGANDVVNPGARDDAGSPIYGMPILNVDRAGQVIVLKRSLSPGFAGIDNDLFYKGNTSMLFGDARESLVRVIAAIEDL
ncbi:MAG: NAD(P)(+) transhydrogenase (Re/Si-specific) subunit beta [SAR202 cluster bacterium]|nr:NAD(P)(+) transhydrogenase (Re/Si-specific) subunit beta [SAR202 cluster bacterium]